MAFGNDQRTSEVCLGYYDSFGDPKLISPIHTFNDFPQLTELHESIHKYLAECNNTDALCRLFTHILRTGQSEINNVHREAIEIFTRIVHKHSALVHETVATYLSMLPYSVTEPDRIKIVRRRLPPFYRGALEAGEAAFGQLEENSSPEFGTIAHPIVLGAGIAAMNLDYRNIPVSLSDLTDCCRFVESNPPDQRFRQILNKLRPFSSAGILAETFDETREKDVDAQQQCFYLKLRRVLPSLRFVPNHKEGNVWLHQLVGALREELNRYGYRRAAANTFLIKPKHDNVHEGMGTRVEIPGIEPNFPLDASLLKLPYQEGSLDDLDSALQTCVATGAILCGHLLPSAPITTWGFAKRQDCVLSWFLMPPGLTTFAGLKGLSGFFYTQSQFSDILRHLRGGTVGSVILKIDERLANRDLEAITGTGHYVIVLIHDNTPRHVVELIEGLARVSPVDVVEVAMAFESYRAILVRPRGRLTYFVAPLGGLGSDIIGEYFGNSVTVKIIQDSATVQSTLGSDLAFIGGVLLTTYCL